MLRLQPLAAGAISPNGAKVEREMARSSETRNSGEKPPVAVGHAVTQWLLKLIQLV
jgi:hypothetical protein